MHHYPFHVGDYASHTQHLDEIEDLAYRRMLDYVYLNEINLPESVDEVARLIRMRAHCERIAVVLREFFSLENGEWVNKRASEEIEKYKSKSEKAKLSASKRWENADANALRTQSDGNANQNQNQNQNHNKIPSSSVDDRRHPDYQAIVDLYHQILPSLPSVKILSDKRKSAIRSCCNLKPSYYGLDFWEAYFLQASKSDLIMGRKMDWKADFDFLVTKSKFIKTLEGSYV